MHDGNIVMDGPPAEIYGRTEELESLQIGIPQITHLTKILMDQGVPLPHVAISVEEAEEMLVKLLGDVASDPEISGRLSDGEEKR